MFHFAWPWIAAFLPLPILVYLFLRAGDNEASGVLPRLRFSNFNALKNAYGVGGRRGVRRIAPVLMALAWLLFVVALMRPEFTDRLVGEQSDGHDVMLAVDLSGSMQSADFVVNGKRVDRLDVAKKVVKDFVAKKSADRVGLIVFGQHAYMQAPLTLDHHAVSAMLDNTLPGMAGDATAIGDAIGLAVKNLRDRPASSRALVLLTDGEDNASTLPPLEAAKLANQYGIRIYTVVIGEDGIVPYPDGQGGYTQVESHVDTSLTEKIAQMTGGEFYRATDAKMLAKIYDHIASLQTTRVDRPPLIIHRPLFQYPLASALALFLAFGLCVLIRGDDYELQSI